ncbi:MAG TPA: undecaprenyl-diphosphate phosphatase, partial [Acidobacteriota bacterium]|nr:undecaprenyl-diphosphate phosphatase [Acidobacteriota bacterium]
IAAVPLLLAAGCFELAGSWAELSAGDLLFLLVGFVIAFASAWLAVKGFIHLLSRATLRPFAWYRLALVPLILIFWPKD